MNLHRSAALPPNWEIKPARFLFSILNGATPSSSESSYWDGDIYWATPQDIGALKEKILKDTQRKITSVGYKNSGTQLAPIGSIVLTTRAPVGNLALTGVPLCTNQGCKTLVSISETTHPEYFFYQLLARRSELEMLSTGTTFQELGTEKLRALELWVPPVSEQRTIAVFLDRETAKLDTLIDALERLLALLAEKRRALIAHAVTRGLNATAPLRDSGVEWLGKVPKHWEVARLKALCSSLQTGPFGSQLHAEEYVDNGIPVINPAHLVDNRIVPDYSVSVNEWMAEYLSVHKLEAGDIVFARRGEIGRCGLVTEKETGWLCGTGSLRARPNQEVINPEYLIWLITNSFASDWLSLMAVGTTMSNLNTAIVGELTLPVPPLAEQNQIVAFINQTIMHLDELQVASGKMKNLLYERRAALITAAVSGKIDVWREQCKSTD